MNAETPVEIEVFLARCKDLDSQGAQIQKAIDTGCKLTFVEVAAERPNGKGYERLRLYPEKVGLDFMLLLIDLERADLVTAAQAIINAETEKKKLIPPAVPPGAFVKPAYKGLRRICWRRNGDDTNIKIMTTKQHPRKEGHYVVKYKGQWVVAQWLDWQQPGSTASVTAWLYRDDNHPMGLMFPDAELDDIRETRIPMPDEINTTTLRYDLITAYDTNILIHPQKVMEAIGYKVLNYADGGIGDCVFIKVAGAVHLMPVFCSLSDYAFTEADFNV